MDNLFYSPPESFLDLISVEIKGQEAKHISKVLRFSIGDIIYVTDGIGHIYQCEIANITKKGVFASIKDQESHQEPDLKKVMAFGAIKKRDRLEFAIEKAVELGAWEICVFQADHSERSKINHERLQSIAVSAFKQSKRKWLPDIIIEDSLDKVYERYADHYALMAHVESEVQKPQPLTHKHNLFLIGPEGGFSEREINLARDRGTGFISLGENRLRAETAVVTILSYFIFESK